MKESTKREYPPNPNKSCEVIIKKEL